MREDENMSIVSEIGWIPDLNIEVTEKLIFQTKGKFLKCISKCQIKNKFKKMSSISGK